MATVRHLGLFPQWLRVCGPLPASAPQPHPSATWMSQSDAVAMFWRVKKWRFNLDANWGDPDLFFCANIDCTEVRPDTYEYSVSREVEFLQQSSYNKEVVVERDENGEITGFPVVDTYTISPSFDTLLGRTANEKDIVCGPPFAGFTDYKHFAFYERVQTNLSDTDSALYSITPPSLIEVSTEWDLRRYFGFNAMRAFFFREAGGTYEYLPNIRFLGSAYGFYFSPYTPYQPGGSPTTDGTTIGTFSYSFLGKTFSTNMLANPAPDTGIILQVNVSIEAIEYWPYDPNDGDGPIYDSTTGAQLRSSPN